MGWVSKNTQSFSNPGKLLASIDPGPAIGKALASVDKFVGDVIPGGWAMVGAIALTVASMGSVNLEGEALAAGAAAEASEAALAAGATAAEAAAAGQAAAATIINPATGLAWTATGSGLSAGMGSVIPTALQSALSAAGTGALYGGGIGGTMSLIQGKDPLKGAVLGALYGGLTGGALSGLESAGINPTVAKALVAATKGAASGQDISSILQNTALSTGLGQLGNIAKTELTPDVGSTAAGAISNAGTGAIGSAIKGGDPLTGAGMGAIGSTLGSAFGALTAPSGKAAPVYDYSTPAPTDVASSTEGESDQLTAAAKQASDALGSDLPSLEKQQAELLNLAGSIKDVYTTAQDSSKELNNFVENSYSPLYKELQGLQNEWVAVKSEYESKYAAFSEFKDSTVARLDGYKSDIDAQQKIYDENKHAYDSLDRAKELKAQIDAAQKEYNFNKLVVDQLIKTPGLSMEVLSDAATPYVNAANAAAKQLNDIVPQYNDLAEPINAANNAAQMLNSLVPQYNTLAEQLTAKNNELTNYYTSTVAPLKDNLQTTTEYLNVAYEQNIKPLQENVAQYNDQLNKLLAQYETSNKDFLGLSSKVTDNITALNDVASGKLPTSIMLGEQTDITAPTAENTGANLENMIAVTTKSGEALFFNPADGQVYNPDGSLNVAESQQEAAPGTVYAPTAGVTVEGLPTSDVGGTSTPLVKESAFTSPYLQDANGSILYGADGKPIPNPLAQSSTDTGVTGTDLSGGTTSTGGSKDLPELPTMDELNKALADQEITDYEYKQFKDLIDEQTRINQVITDTSGLGTSGSGTGGGTTPGTGTGTTTGSGAGTSTTPGTGTSTGTGTVTPPTPVSQTTNANGSITTTYSDGSTSTAPGAGTSAGGGGTGGTAETGGTGTGGTSETGGTTGSGTGAGTTGTGTGTGTGAGTGTGGTGTGTGSGGTGTGGGSTGTGGGSTGTGTGGTRTGIGLGAGAGAAATAARTGIKDLTPQLTQATPFKFANEPTFSDQLTNMAAPTPFDYTEQIANAASGGSITDIKPQLTKRTGFSFANQPKFETPLSPIQQPTAFDYTKQFLGAAEGGLIQGFAEGSGVGQVEGVEVLRPQVTHGRRVNPFFQGANLVGMYRPQQYAEGGTIPEGHNPQFFSEGGLNSLENTYVQGEGDGTSDSVPAMLADGEFVIPADVVSKLGNGSNKAGAGVLDQFLASIRQHAQNHDPKKLPPESKGPLAYLLDAKRKVG